MITTKLSRNIRKLKISPIKLSYGSFETGSKDHLKIRINEKRNKTVRIENKEFEENDKEKDESSPKKKQTLTTNYLNDLKITVKPKKLEATFDYYNMIDQLSKSSKKRKTKKLEENDENSHNLTIKTMTAISQQNSPMHHHKVKMESSVNFKAGNSSNNQKYAKNMKFVKIHAKVINPIQKMLKSKSPKHNKNLAPEENHQQKTQNFVFDDKTIKVNIKMT